MIYRIKQGDTLTSIGNELGLAPSIIVSLNRLSPNTPLIIGDELFIPSSYRLYTVAQGDTLYSVANDNGVSINSILADNPQLGGNPLVYPEQTLIINTGDNRERSITVNGYLYPFISDEVLRTVLPYLTYATIFTYGFKDGGELIPADDEKILEAAKSYGVGTLLLISTLGEDGNFNNMLSTRLFDDPDAEDNLIQNLLNTVREKGYAGVEVDFEFLPAEDAPRYVDFLSKLSAALKPEGYLLLAALAPKTSADQLGLLYQGHDYSGIGSVVDYVILMTYEWGYKYGPPGAVAPIRNVERVVEYAVTEIPPSKLLLGVPNYGYDWPLPFVMGQTEAETLATEAAVRRAGEVGVPILYDENAQSPFFEYSTNGTDRVVWFENASSVTEKLGLVDRYDLAGISIWNIMRYFPQLYGILSDSYTITPNG